MSKKMNFIFILITLLLVGCTKAPLTKQNFVLGTIVSITLYDHQSEDLLDVAFNQLEEIESNLSIHSRNTLIRYINQNAGNKSVKVDEETYDLIEKGVYYSDLTDGAFDITIGALSQLWDIGFPTAHVPNEEEIEMALPYIDYHLITLDEENQAIYLEKEGVLLDLGGIAKGYAADKVRHLLQENGVESAIINIGGNVVVLGNTPKIIGIQDPFNPRGEILGKIELANKSIVTSGIYERYLTDENGNTYHHILDPKTGYPFDNDLVSITIISDASLDGDALSTATFALGLKDGMAFIENIPNVEGIFVTKDGKVHTTSGCPEIINPNQF